MNINEAIKAVISRQNLNESEMHDVMSSIMTGQTTDAQIGAFLVGLSMKGETIEEITASAKVMRALATSVKLSSDEFREFKSGMVTTVEPGIYIRRDDKIESKYWGIGVRIEDDVLVTEAGNHVLSKKAVKDIDEIEYLMSQR